MTLSRYSKFSSLINLSMHTHTHVILKLREIRLRHEEEKEKEQTKMKKGRRVMENEIKIINDHVET